MWELSSSSNLRHHPGSNCNSPVRLAHSESPLTCCLALPNKLFHFPSCHVPNACCAQICLEYGTLLVLRTHLVYLQQTVFGSNSAVIYSPRFGASCLISCNWFCKSSPELRLAQDFQDNQKQVECRYQSIYIFVFCQLYTWKGSLPIFACWSPTQFVAWLDTMRYAKACAPFYESGWVKICIHDQTATTYIKNTTSNILTWAVFFLIVPCPIHWVNAYANASTCLRGLHRVPTPEVFNTRCLRGCLRGVLCWIVMFLVNKDCIFELCSIFELLTFIRQFRHPDTAIRQ